MFVVRILVTDLDFICITRNKLEISKTPNGHVSVRLGYIYRRMTLEHVHRMCSEDRSPAHILLEPGNTRDRRLAACLKGFQGRA